MLAAVLMWLALAQAVDLDATRLEAMNHVRQGQRFMAAENYQRAADEFRIAIDLDAKLYSAHYGLGQAHMALREYPDAIRAYQGALRVFEEDRVDTASNRVAADQAREDQIRALRDSIAEARALSGPMSAAQQSKQESIIGHLEIQIAQLDRMRGTRASSLDPPATLLLALGSAYFRNDQWAEAEREYRAAIRADEKLGEARNNLAVVLLLTNRAAEARAEVALAEKAGYRVATQLKNDIEKAAASN
jgi:tetratricopeptide (TPR) repeat protein